jgi:NADH:ubiquinone oxidoreductase subunit 3 (subunit A)
MSPEAWLTVIVHVVLVSVPSVLTWIIPVLAPTVQTEVSADVYASGKSESTEAPAENAGEP